MLDLEKRTPELMQNAENAVKNGKLLTELLNGMLSKNNSQRYDSFKTVYLISEDHPENYSYNFGSNQVISTVTF